MFDSNHKPNFSKEDIRRFQDFEAFLRMSNTVAAGEPAPKKKRRSRSDATIIDRIVEAIKKAGKPLTLQQLEKRLKIPKQNISSALTDKRNNRDKRKRVKRVSRGVYDLV